MVWPLCGSPHLRSSAEPFSDSNYTDEGQCMSRLVTEVFDLRTIWLAQKNGILITNTVVYRSSVKILLF